jgi:signal transduction histidine kinase
MEKQSSISDQVKRLTEERNLFARLLEESQHRFEDKIKELSLLKRIGDIISSSFDIELVCRNLAQSIIEETSAENCSLMLKDPDEQHLILKVACGSRDKKIAFFDDFKNANVIFTLGEGVAGKVALEGKAIVIDDVKSDDRFDHTKKSALPIASLLCCPLVMQNQVMGVINMSSSRLRAFSQNDLRIISMFSAFVSSIFNNAVAYHELKKSEGELRKKSQELSDSNKKLERAHKKLTSIQEHLELEIEERVEAEKALQNSCDEIELRVKEGTAELERSNERLRKEIQDREQMEGALRGAKERAEAADKAKSEFLANMNHEFRTPMNHIIGFTELVCDKHFGELNETQEEYLNDVLKSSKHLFSLIADLLDLAKGEEGTLELEPADINLKTVLERALMMFKEKSAQYHIQLSLEADHIPETITADLRKLKQIIYSLLSNAMKFTPQGGKVSLKAQMVDCVYRSEDAGRDLQIIAKQSGSDGAGDAQRRKCVAISVVDTGIGIKAEDQERIFASFEQADGSSSRKYQGMGMGLALTKKFVDLHEGKLWMESAGEGKGTTFNVVIPV